MIFLEILFIVSLIECLIAWVWFIILGFRANKTWGFSIVFLTPITPFMFALRFTRKARKAIYCYVISLIALVILNSYIVYSRVNFYENIWQEITAKAMQVATIEVPSLFDFRDLFSNNTVEALAPKVKARPVLTRSAVIQKKAYHVPIKRAKPKPYSYYKKIKPSSDYKKTKRHLDTKKLTPKKRGYQAVSIGVLTQYINKKIMITTTRVQHKGRLISVTESTVLIKKRVSSGFVTMPIKKNKIKHVKIYL
ncbi:MAG: hypothetical protein KAG10_00530 [Methylococcales bacterium]|nr:hypothetical protein [Methylococcales bacterium]